MSSEDTYSKHRSEEKDKAMSSTPLEQHGDGLKAPSSIDRGSSESPRKRHSDTTKEGRRRTESRKQPESRNESRRHTRLPVKDAKHESFPEGTWSSSESVTL